MVPLVVPISPYSKVVFSVPVSFSKGAREGDVVARRATKELGEVVVYLVVKQHRYFDKRGDSLYCTKWVSPWSRKVRVRGLGSRPWPLKGDVISFDLPRARDGIRLRAKGRGLPVRGSKDRGDLVVTVRIRPRSLACLFVALRFSPFALLLCLKRLGNVNTTTIISRTAPGARPIARRLFGAALSALFFSQDLRDYA